MRARVGARGVALVVRCAGFSFVASATMGMRAVVRRAEDRGCWFCFGRSGLVGLSPPGGGCAEIDGRTRRVVAVRGWFFVLVGGFDRGVGNGSIAEGGEGVFGYTGGYLDDGDSCSFHFLRALSID
jgi:hypothetical protein